VRVETGIGWFVNRVVATEGIMPGVIGCSHHFGRWRLAESSGGERWATSFVEISSRGGGTWFLRRKRGAGPWASPDPDSSRVW
jgi:hypothetical protein